MEYHANIEQDPLLMDIATRHVALLAPESSVGEAARVMTENRISSIVVTDADGRPLGIVTERNLLHALQSGCQPETALENVMSSPVIAVPESMTCLGALERCLSEGIRHLVIVSDDKTILGVVTETDFRLHGKLSVPAGRRQVAAIMRRSVFTLPPAARLQEAWDHMQAHRDSCVVVVEDERPVGIVTERDSVRLYSGNLKRSDIPVGDVMTSPVLTLTPDDAIDEALARMLAGKARHLAVVDGEGRLAGMLGAHDLICAMAADLIDDKRIAEGAFLHILMKSLPDSVWLKDANGVYLACNRRYEQLLGAEEKDIVGKSDYDFMDKALADSLGRYERSTLDKDAAVLNEEWVSRAAGEHRKLLEILNVPMRDSRGSLVGVLGIGRDIGGRRLLEAKLKESEERLKFALEGAGDGVWDWNPQTDEALFSKQYEAMIGYAEHEFPSTGAAWVEHLHPDDRERVLSVVQNYFLGNQTTYVVEFRLRCKDGSWKWILARGKLINRDADGKPLRMIGTHTDITERKLAEQALLESKGKLRAQKEFLASIFENALDAVILMDSKGIITGWNSQAEKVFGWSREEAVGRLMHETIVPPRYRDAHVRGMRHFLSTGEGAVLNKRIEIDALHRDGREFRIELSISPLKKADGYEFSSFIRDISERKRLEQRLAEREELFSAIFNQTPNGVELVDTETLRFVEANPAACRMLGYTHEEYLQLRLEDIQADLHGEALAEAVRQLDVLGETAFENRHRCKNGDILDVEINARMLDLSDKRLVIGVWRDITERKRTEDALRESEEKLRSLYELSPLGIALTDMNGRYVEFNESFRRICGYSEEALKALDYWALTPKKYEAEELKQLESLADTGRYGPYEKEYIRRDGSLVQLRLNGVLVRGKDGGQYIWSIVEDISEYKRAEENLAAREREFRALAENSPDNIARYDCEARLLYINPTFERTLGRASTELMGKMPREFTVDKLFNEYQKAVLSVGASGKSISFEQIIPVGAEGLQTHFIRMVAEMSPDGTPVGVLAVGRDISEIKLAEENLRITAGVFDNCREAILITDANNLIIDVNPAFTQITGYNRENVLGKNPRLLSSGRHDKAFYTAMWQSLEQKKAWRGEIWNQRKSGEIYAELLSIAVICNNDGLVQRYVGVFSDISHIKEYEAELSRVAHYDALTGIPNRILLADRMKQAIAQTAREQNMLAVCYLDLDGFKSINDTMGHEAGDQVLVEVARRIGGAIRGGDTVARLGGDEFVLLLQGLEKGEECLETLERLLEVIARPMTIKNKSYTLSASIGVSIYPLDDEDPDILLRHADQVMYVAKRSGKNRFYIYDSALDLRARNHQEFMKSIRHGLECGQFELYYQPKVNLRTRRLAGAEALIRWRHPERGLLPPAEFLRPIENTELELEIGAWVIAAALEQIDRWQRAGLEIEVSINISTHHLETPHFAEKLRQQLERYPDMPPGRLQIEVLESTALNDITIVREVIEVCRKFGVKFALDDFGTGYSTLSYLSGLPVDVLKIDQSFVRDMLEDKGDMAIIQGIIALARVFDRQIVAEGIECEGHYRALLDIGCEVGQGHFIARPMPAEELANWLTRWLLSESNE